MELFHENQRDGVEGVDRTIIGFLNSWIPSGAVQSSIDSRSLLLTCPLGTVSKLRCSFTKSEIRPDTKQLQSLIILSPQPQCKQAYVGMSYLPQVSTLGIPATISTQGLQHWVYQPLYLPQVFSTGYTSHCIYPRCPHWVYQPLYLPQVCTLGIPATISTPGVHTGYTSHCMYPRFPHWVYQPLYLPQVCTLGIPATISTPSCPHWVHQPLYIPQVVRTGYTSHYIYPKLSALGIPATISTPSCPHWVYQPLYLHQVVRTGYTSHYIYPKLSALGTPATLRTAVLADPNRKHRREYHTYPLFLRWVRHPLSGLQCQNNEQNNEWPPSSPSQRPVTVTNIDCPTLRYKNRKKKKEKKEKKRP